MRRARKSDPYERDVGLRVRSLRIARRMSQSELGARLGVSFQQIQKCEAGTNRISAGRLRRIAELFDVPIQVLFGRRGGEAAAGEDPLEVLRPAGAIRLLEAYGRIPSAKLRLSLVRLAEQLTRR